MKKKLVVLVMAFMLTVSVPVFAEETTAAAPGIKPDSPLYVLDKLAEKIQLAIITDAVKEAEALAAIAQERLAESKAMAEASKVAEAAKAINEYAQLMDKAIDVIDDAAKDGEAVTEAIDKIVEYDSQDEAVLDKLMDIVPAEYREELEKAVAALPEKEAVEEKEEEAEKVSAATAVLTGRIQDKAVLSKIQQAGLNNRQISAIVSLSEQSGKALDEVLELFLTNERGIGKTIIELKLAPKDAMKAINKTFKEVKKEIKAGVVKSEESDKAEDDKDDNKDTAAVKEQDGKDNKEAEKLEKKVEKAADKLEKKIEQTEKKYEKKLGKKTEKATDDDDKDDKED